MSGPAARASKRRKAIARWEFAAHVDHAWHESALALARIGAEYLARSVQPDAQFYANMGYSMGPIGGRTTVTACYTFGVVE